jgi:hypothetical protein
MCISKYLYIDISTYLYISISLNLCISKSLYLYMPISLYIYIYLYLSVYPTIYLSIYLPIYLPTYLPAYLPTYLYIYMYIYTYIYLHTYTYTLGFAPVAARTGAPSPLLRRRRSWFLSWECSWAQFQPCKGGFVYCADSVWIIWKHMMCTIVEYLDNNGIIMVIACFFPNH